MTQDQRESTNFPFELARRLADAKWPVQYDFLYYHQNLARIYASEPTTRGLLIFHGTGMGKSILAASIAMDAIFPEGVSNISGAAGGTAGSESRRVIVLLAKSLAINMMDAVEQYIVARREHGGVAALGAFGALAALPDDKRREWVRKNFSFVTMNASNMYIQMSRATFISEEDEDLLFDSKAKDLSSVVPNLDNKLLIVDEAHNFFRAIINGSVNSANLYELIMGAKNLKIIFLTGTPIASHPFEMAVCFNMLAGKQILPIHFEDFTRMFVGPNHLIAHREKFQNRIFGLVSFVNYESHPGIGTADILASITNASAIMSSVPSTDATVITALSQERTKQRVEFPEELPLEIVRVPMTVEQYDAYIMAREREKSEGLARAMREGEGVAKDGADGAHNLDDDWETPVLFVDGAAMRKTIIKQPRRMFIHETPALHKPKSAFSSSYRVHSRQISNYCPPLEIRKRITLEKDEIPVSGILDAIGQIHSVKFQAILEKLRKHKGQLGMIYSQFVGLGGLAALARFLEQNGYNDNYVVISGEVPAEERAQIVANMGDPENRHGEKCTLLLVSSTGAEGLDLKNIRHVHILEPYWNFGRIKQVKARAIRHLSHADLPPEERNVAVYVYIAVPPEISATSAPTADGTTVPVAMDDQPSEELRRKSRDEPTSDEELYTYARESQLLIDSFESAMKEVSIECAINHTSVDRAAHCRICAPSGEKLFTENTETDVFVTPDPCRPVTSRKVIAKKIKVGSETFYYRKAEENSIEARLDGFEIFLEDSRIHAWRKLTPSDTRYAVVASAIVNLEGRPRGKSS